MNTPLSPVQVLNNQLIDLQKRGVVLLTADDVPLSERKFLQIDGQNLLNFSSCNYIGLETDTRLKQAAIDAVERYGVQFYCVRAYVSLYPYQELEALLEEMFQHPVVITPTTMLGHLSFLPIIVGAKDALILDHQVHATVNVAARLCRTNGTHTEMIRHNRVDYLENRLKKLKDTHEKIWYLADGVYSMYGNLAEYEALYSLVQQYEQLHLYIDDSHGMSWTGKHGTGTMLEKMPIHPRVTLVTSLGKAFGATGGVGVFHDEKTRELVRNCSTPLIFTGPIQPPILAAAVASAKIHLSDEIYILQSALKRKIQFFAQKAQELGLPIIGRQNTPIFFLGVSSQEVGCLFCELLRKAGFYGCLAGYPAVPVTRTGVRFLLTMHHTEEDITNLLETVAALLPISLRAYNFSMEQIHKAFEIEQELELVEMV